MRWASPARSPIASSSWLTAALSRRAHRPRFSPIRRTKEQCNSFARSSSAGRSRARTRRHRREGGHSRAATHGKSRSKSTIGLQQEVVMRLINRSVIGLLAFGFALGIGAAAVRADDPTVPGVSFNGGDGSYKRVLADGITLGISNDPPYTFQDESTKQYDGIDVRIFTEICKRLGITKVKWEIVQFDALIPGIAAKRWDVVVDNLHENPKRLAVVAFTSPAYWYGSALAVQKGNPKNLHTSGDMAGHTVGTVRGSFNQGLLEKRTDLKELKLYTSNEAEFADLIAGRVDVIMEDDIKIGHFMKNHPDPA